MEKQPSHFYQVLVRVANITGWRKSKYLAAFLETTSQSVSEEKEKGRFPAEWAFKIAQAYNVSTDWLLTGKSPEAPELSPSSRPYIFQDHSLNPQGRGNALRFAKELANILEKQRRQTAEAQSLLERIKRVIREGGE